MVIGKRFAEKVTFKQKSKEARFTQTWRKNVPGRGAVSAKALRRAHTWLAGGQCMWIPVSRGREEEGPHQAGLSSPNGTSALTLSKMGPLEDFEHASYMI